tara:strand:- start:65 stop:283 length:219 start_codon:yes stop_codon:yes gene_type:complete
MPEGMGYPKGKGILGKIEQGDFSPDVAKRPNDKLEIDANAKVKQGSLGPDHALGKKEKVDASIFKKAEERDY